MPGYPNDLLSGGGPVDALQLEAIRKKRQPLVPGSPYLDDVVDATQWESPYAKYGRPLQEALTGEVMPLGAGGQPAGSAQSDYKPPSYSNDLLNPQAMSLWDQLIPAAGKVMKGAQWAVGALGRLF